MGQESSNSTALKRKNKTEETHLCLQLPTTTYQRQILHLGLEFALEVIKFLGYFQSSVYDLENFGICIGQDKLLTQTFPFLSTVIAYFNFHDFISANIYFFWWCWVCFEGFWWLSFLWFVSWGIACVYFS